MSKSACFYNSILYPYQKSIRKVHRICYENKLQCWMCEWKEESNKQEVNDLNWALLCEPRVTSSTREVKKKTLGKKIFWIFFRMYRFVFIDSHNLDVMPSTHMFFFICYYVTASDRVHSNDLHNLKQEKEKKIVLEAVAAATAHRTNQFSRSVTLTCLLCDSYVLGL